MNYRGPVVIDGFTIDCTLSESVELQSEVTENPVESGSTFVDNIRNKPLEISIDGIISNTPTAAIAAQRLAEELPSSAAFNKFNAIREKREPITIKTSYRTYERMALTMLSLPNDASTGDALRFRATFRQIQTITNERTVIVVAVPRGSAKRNLGNKPSPPVSKTSEQDALAKASETAVGGWIDDNASWLSKIAGR